MKELIIKKDEQQIVLMDKNDIIEALSEKANKNDVPTGITTNILNITTDKGEASEETMNQFYIEIDGNKRNIYYTVEENGSYSWVKLDSDILDDLSIDWDDIQNKPDIPTKTSDLINDNGFVSIELTDTLENLPDGVFLLIEKPEFKATLEFTEEIGSIGIVDLDNTGITSIDWGDGSITSIDTNYISHEYEDIGIYTIKIENPKVIPRFYTDYLISVEIPNTVISIKDKAFMDCIELKSVILPNSLKILPSECFSGCSQLTSIKLPKNLEKIEERCFGDCIRLTSINIPDSVTELGGFANCSNLTSINIPDSVRKLTGYALYGCEKLTSIDIPNSVTSIGGYCFGGCINLRSVDIPDSITELLEGTFNGCKDLVVNIPRTITNMEQRVFFKSQNLTCKLNWTGNEILDYNRYVYENVAQFTVPRGELNNYKNKGYPESKLTERDE